MSDQNVPPVTGNKVLKFKVSYSVLRHVMNIPENSKLITIVPDEFDTCHFIVTNDEFPEVETGSLIPETTPTMTEIRDDAGRVKEIMWDWNIEEESKLKDAISYRDLSRVSRNELEEFKKRDWTQYSSEIWRLIRTVDFLTKKLDRISSLTNDASGRTQDVTCVLDDIENEACRII